jgi:hypothetical protein
MLPTTKTKTSTSSTVHYLTFGDLEAHQLEEWGKRVLALVETVVMVSKQGERLLEWRDKLGGRDAPLLRPADSGVVHLVDHDNEVLDTSRLCEHGVLSRLAALVEARLELTTAGGDDLITS